jgi:hypothetical protein
MSQLIKVELPAACGEGAVIEVDTGKFPAHIIAALVAHGLKQKLADAVAGDLKAGTPKAECMAAVQAGLASLMVGTWAKRGGARINSLESYMNSETIKLAKARIVKDEKESTKPAYMVQLAKENWLAHVTKAYRENAEMQARWAKEWEARSVKTEIEIEI